MVRAEVEAILEDAAAAAGLDDFGDDWFLGPLTAWVEDLAAARPQRCSAAVPPIAGREGRRPPPPGPGRAPPAPGDRRGPDPAVLYITGQERSGYDVPPQPAGPPPGRPGPLRWELMEPVPPPEAESYSRRPPHRRSPGLDREATRSARSNGCTGSTPTNPRSAPGAFIDAMSMLGRRQPCGMPRWRDFLWTRIPPRRTSTIGRCCQILLWKHPVAPTAAWSSSPPRSRPHPGAFAAVFPEAALRRHRSRSVPLRRLRGRHGALDRRALLRGQPAHRRRSPGSHRAGWISQSLATVSEFHTASRTGPRTSPTRSPRRSDLHRAWPLRRDRICRPTTASTSDRGVPRPSADWCSAGSTGATTHHGLHGR